MSSWFTGWLFVLLSLMALTTPALAATKTVNGISAEVNLPNAQRGVAYSATIAPTGGGGAPYTFQVTAGALPSGFTLSSSGALAGTNCNAANGSYPFSVRITSSTGTVADFTGSAQFSVQMTAGPGSACSLALAALPTTGTIGTPYSGTAAVTGGTAPYTWAQTAGTLPPGLALDTGTGAVSGTPTASGTYAFTLEVADSAGAAGVSNYTITIAPVITVNPATLPGGLQGIAYSQTVSGSGGTAPYTFSVSAGALPTGLSLSPTGTLAGTPTVPGTYDFTVRAIDANGFSGSRTYAVAVAAAPTITVSPASVPDGLQNKPYATQTIVASGGTSPYAYAISSGTLPAGLTLSIGGVLAGTPTASGPFTFTVTATDASGYTANHVYSITVAAQPTIVVDPTMLTTALQNIAYSQTIGASGGTAAYTFAVTSGALPAGLTLAPDGTLSGTPTASGTFDFTVTATDANTYTGQRSYTLGVTAAPAIVVGPSSLAPALQSQPYSQSITGAGGTGPYTFTVVGSLPAGLTLSPSGLLSGTPSVSGAFDFSIQAADASGYVGTRAYALDITAAPTISLTPLALPDALEHLLYAPLAITAAGGTSPYTYDVTSGTLPAGLSLASDGVLAGTASEPGTFTFTVTATDASNYAGSRAYTLTVIEAPTVSLSPVSLPAALENTVYGPQAITATGGTAPYSYAVTGGTLPAGLGLAADGTLSGTPTESGTFSFTVTATDANEYVGARAYTLAVAAAPTITVDPPDLPGALQGNAYGPVNLTASGGTGPYAFGVTAGALPAGLTLATGGALSGTPQVSGSFEFTVTATDSGGLSGTRAYSLDVAAQPAITLGPASLPGGLQDQSYPVQTITATGGIAPYAYAVTAGAPPSGLGLAADGTLAGTPTESGSFNFTVTATDAGGFVGSRGYSIVVTVVPTITINPTSLPAALEDRPYAPQNLAASGGTAPYTYAITTGSLPSGLTFSSGGVLSGTPGVAGAFTFTVTATDADGYAGSQAYALDVSAQPDINLSPVALPVALENKPYAPQQVTATGGATPYTYAVTSGTLPAGVTLSAAGVLSGTPTGSGAFNFTVTATDANGYTANRSYTFDVTSQPVVTLSPVSLPAALQDQAYDPQSIVAAGGTAPYAYAITAGALPAGMSLSSEGGLTGTPTVSGAFAFTVTATDANGYAGSLQYELDVTAAPTITISPASLPAVLQGQPYAQTIAASGGTPAYTYAVTGGALPAGLALASGGALSGTPTAAGAFNITVTATDARGYTASQAFTLTVNAPLQAAAADPVPSITAGGAITPFIPVTASGGTAPYTYSISPGLPAGMTFDPVTGRIAGTPTQSQLLTTYTVTIQDASGENATMTFELQALAYTVSFTPAAADLGRAGLPVDLSFAGAGGSAPYVFMLESGALPGGLSLSLAGNLAGRTAQAGTYPVQLRMTDANGVTVVMAVTFTVGEPRPDPTLDAGVQALQTAQADSLRRFGRAQTGNAVRRLEQLRSCSAPGNQLNVQVGHQGSVPVGQLTEGARKSDCEQQRSTWVAGTVVLADGVDGGDRLTTDGVTVGVDLRVSDTLTLGTAIGYSREGESRLAGGAKLSGDGYGALAYGAWKLQPQVYVEGLVGYGKAGYDISRLIAEEDVRATAQRDASHWFGSLGIAAHMVLARTILQPYLRADYQAASFDAYREHGASSLALRYDSLDSDTLGYTGGVRANWSIGMSFGSFDPMLRLEYRGENRSSLHQHLEYADGLDEIDYTLRNGSGKVTSGLVGAGFGLRFLNGVSAELEYQATFGSDLPDDTSVGAIVNWAF